MKTAAALPAVESPGLLVREIHPRDWEAMARFMTARDYQRHIALRLKNIDEVKNFVARNVARQDDTRRNVFHLAAESKETGDVVGDGFIIFQRPKVFEIGWGLAPRLWGNGLGTEIGRSLLGLAFEHLDADEVWCKVMAPNGASANLARRVGMAYVSSKPDHPMGGGRFGPVDLFALKRADYFDLPY